MTTSPEINTAQKPPLELETKFFGVIAREHTPEADETLLALANDPAHAEYFRSGGLMLDKVFPDADAIAQLKESGAELYDIVVNDEYAGGGVLVAAPDENNRREISYWNHPDAAHKGKTIAAVNAVVNHHREQGYDIVASVLRTNGRSQRLLHTLGFTALPRQENTFRTGGGPSVTYEGQSVQMIKSAPQRRSEVMPVTPAITFRSIGKPPAA